MKLEGVLRLHIKGTGSLRVCSHLKQLDGTTEESI